MATGTIDDTVDEEKLKQEGIPESLSAEDAHNLTGKKEENLEDKVSTFSFKSLVDLSATAALGIYSGGLINYLCVAGVYSAVNWIVNKSKTSAQGILSEFKTAGIITAALKYTFKFLDYMKGFSPTASLWSQYAYATLGIALVLPLFNLGFHTVDYFFKSGKSLLDYALKPWRLFTSYAKELYEKRLKPEYIKSTLKTYLIAPLMSAVAVFAPLYNLGNYKIAVSSAVRFFYRLMVGSAHKDKDADNRPFYKYLINDYFTWPADARKKREEEYHKKKQGEETQKKEQQQQQMQQLMQQMGQGQGSR